jgi:hypothetical protein
MATGQNREAGGSPAQSRYCNWRAIRLPAYLILLAKIIEIQGKVPLLT